MKKGLIVLSLVLVTLLISTVVFASCIEKQKVIDSMEFLLNQGNNNMVPGTTLAVCDPCSCPTMFDNEIEQRIACNRYQIEQDNQKLIKLKEAKKIIDQLKKGKVCPDNVIDYDMGTDHMIIDPMPLMILDNPSIQLLRN